MRFHPSHAYRRGTVILAAAALTSVGLAAAPLAGASAAPARAAAAHGPAAGAPLPPSAPAPTNGPPITDRPDPAVHNPTGSPPPVPSGAWQALGPAAIGPSASAFAGRVTGVVVIPSGTHAGRVVIGSAGGGIWTSDDNGTTWTARTDSLPDLAIGALAEDPSTPDHLIAGTGEANHCGDCFYGDGILTSSDGGTTWTRQDPGSMFDGLSMEQVAIDPTNSNHQFAATNNGLYVTTNGGTSWALPSDVSYGNVAGSISSVVIDPSNASNVYIGTSNGLVGKSTDGGLTWTASNTGLTGTSVLLEMLTIDPSNPATIYVSLGGESAVKLYKSTDHGATWTQLTGAPDYTGVNYYYGFSSGDQGWYDNAIAVDPTNSNHLIAGGIALVQSTDGGATWSKINVIHPDQHAIFFTSTGDAWIGDDGGVFRYSHGGTYSDMNGNLNITQFYYGFNVVGSTLLAGSQDNGTAITTSGSLAAWSEVLGGDGGPSFITPNDTSLQFAEATGNLYETTDGWASTFNKITPFAAGDFTPPMTVVPNSTTPSSPTVFIGGSDLYRSTNPSGGSSSFTQVTSVGTKVSAIAASPSDPNVVYVGFNDGTIQVSTDGGATFTSLASQSLTDRWVTGISVDPTNPKSITVSYSVNDTRYYLVFPHVEQYTYSTTPGSGTWTTITGSGLPNAVSRVVYDNGTLLAATDSGVYATSSPSGSSTVWARVGTGLPNVQVQDLYVTSDGTVYALTHGRGAWKLPAVPTPAIASISPTVGPTAGGTSVTITGSGFTGASRVLFGAAGDAARYTVNSDTQITAVSPAYPSGGNVGVRVFTAAAESPAVSGDIYRYTDALPAITSISPKFGPTAGGTSVAIFGSGFTGATRVLFGSAGDATSFTVNSDTKITATSPANTAGGSVSVRVFTPLGESPATTGDVYFYGAVPTITSISPRFGPTSGGTSVTITGTGFTNISEVLFGSAGKATSYSVNSPTQITAAAPAHSAGGNVSIRVFNPAGESSAVSGDVYFYGAVPMITSISPTSGPAAGGTTVTITGTGFTHISEVLFGSAGKATSYTVNSPTQITATAPAHSAGTSVGIRVFNPAGESSAVSGDVYQYV